MSRQSAQHTKAKEGQDHRLSFLLCLSCVSLCFMLIACGQRANATPPALPLPPTLEALRVAYPPSLRPWAEDLRACAKTVTETAVYLVETSQPSDLLVNGEAEAALVYGFSPWAAELQAYKVGTDQLAFITYPSNPIETLDEAALSALLSGNVNQWQAQASATGVFSATLTLLHYAPEDPLRLALGQMQPRAGTNYLVLPNPAAVLQTVAETPGALGYLPQRWLAANPAVKTLAIDSTLDIVALLPDWASENTRRLIACTAR